MALQQIRFIFRQFGKCSIMPLAAAREAPAGAWPLGGPGGSRAALGGPGPASWWGGGVPGPVGAAAAAAGSRGALPLALPAPRSISAHVFDMVPRSYLGCSVEYRHGLGCFGCAKTMFFHVVTLVLHAEHFRTRPYYPLVAPRPSAAACRLSLSRIADHNS